MTSMGLNADMGESFGAYTIGDDAALLPIVSSTNIACGLHGGDPRIIDCTIRAAKAAGVRMGAHPGFDNRADFGRRVIRVESPEDICIGEEFRGRLEVAGIRIAAHRRGTDG